MYKELEVFRESYMYTATLCNGDTIYAFENGTAAGKSGKQYKIVTHLDENEEVITDGWISADRD